ncbi:MAG: DUF4870 domain-containing protein [Nonlabens sp.]|nr:DUF4870 domain-containing protein [Nonlabens sp.]MDP5101390.1 DUF4870 domain-containing protein [Nonlabens sp.]
MEKNQQNNHTSIAAAIHLLTFGKWIFPLGNLILPIILWTVNSKKSAFIDDHGKEAVNFQLSMTLYTVILAFVGGGIIIGSMITGGPLLWEQFDSGGFPFANDMGIFTTIVASGFICGTAIVVLSITDFICTIQAALHAREGRSYKYPLTINFVSRQVVPEATNAPKEPLNNN